MWIVMGWLLANGCFSDGLNLVRAGDGVVIDDGWRPKGHHRQVTAANQTAALESPSAPAVIEQAVSAVPASEPFDWRDDLDGPSPTARPAAGVKTGEPPAPAAVLAVSTVTPSRWCRCEHSSICGHCGLQRPILAAYGDTPAPLAEPKTMLVDTEQQLPALDRLRLALAEANERVQETLGRF